MRNHNKERLAELTGHIQRSTAAEARMVVEMVGLMVEESRTRLVDAEGQDIYRMQGEARVLTRLYKSLTVKPPTLENI